VSSPSSKVADRVLETFIEIMNARRELGVTEISRSLRMDKGQVHRYLQSLVHQGFVTKDRETHKYSPGLRPLQMLYALDGKFDVLATAKPHLESLRDLSGETVGLASRVGAHRIHLLQAESNMEIHHRFPSGVPLPIHCGAAGRILLAFTDEEEEVDQILSGSLAQITDATICSGAVLSKKLDEVRRDGYATSLGERVPESQSIAAPVWTWRREVLALVVSGPMSRFNAKATQELIPVLGEAAAALTSALCHGSVEPLSSRFTAPYSSKG